MRILAFAPHPDDLAIGCSGTLSKLAKTNSITAVYLTSGEAGSINIPEKQLAKQRETEARKAAKLIGIKKTIFLHQPDSFLKFDKPNLQKIISIIRKEKPSLVFAPYEQDLHRDHKTTFQLVQDALWKSSGPWFKNAGKKAWRAQELLCYETWTPIQKPEHFEDISKTLAKKLKAIRLFKSQVKGIRYDQAIEGLNRFRGIMSGLGQHCECFEVREA